MLNKMSWLALAFAWPLAALAAQPSAADLDALNRSLNPTSTPNAYGLDSHFSGPATTWTPRATMPSSRPRRRPCGRRPRPLAGG
jgi:hypothetical protein